MIEGALSRRVSNYRHKTVPGLDLSMLNWLAAPLDVHKDLPMTDYCASMWDLCLTMSGLRTDFSGSCRMVWNK